MSLLQVECASLTIKSPEAKDFFALRDISFTLGEGEIMGVVGESGAGKTLLSFLLATLLQDDPNYQIEGKINFSFGNNSYDLTQSGEKNLLAYRQKYVGIIFQDPHSALHPTRTCGKQLFNALTLTGERSNKSEVLQLLEDVGFDDAPRIYNSYPHQLSGGECQRVVIAIVIGSKPKLIIADEPTSSLDRNNEIKIFELLLSICKKQKIALVIISHNTQLLARHVNRFLVLNGGYICFDGQLEDVDNSKDPYINKLFASLHDTILNNEHGENADGQILSLKNITFSYPIKSFSWWGRGKRKQFFEHLNLHLYAGEIVGLYGDSGSGKSTIAKIITRLAEIDAGEIIFNNLDLNDIPINTKSPFRNKIQLILQDNFSSFNPAYTIRENFYQVWKNCGLDVKDIKQGILTSIEHVRLNERILDLSPDNLSGGQRQRVMIARALIFNPDILICDESVAAVDMQNRSSILNLLKDLVRERKMTILFISHDINSVNYVSSRIFELKEGQLLKVDLKR